MLLCNLTRNFSLWHEQQNYYS